MPPHKGKGHETGPKCQLNRKTACKWVSANLFILQDGWEWKLTRMRGGWSYPNNMVHRIDVTVSHIHPDGSDGKTIVLPGTVDHNRLMWTGGSCWRISAGRGISWRRRVRGQGVGGHWTSQGRNSKHVCNTEASHQSRFWSHKRPCSQPTPHQPCHDRELGCNRNPFLSNKEII